MSKDRPRNMAASVRARLTDLARKQHEDFQLVLTRYAIERLLYRLSGKAATTDGRDAVDSRRGTVPLSSLTAEVSCPPPCVDRGCARASPYQWAVSRAVPRETRRAPRYSR